MATQGSVLFDDNPVPVIDISGFRDGGDAAKHRIAVEVDAACRSIGFLVITGHGIDPELIASVDDATRRFFDLPEDAKRRCEPPAAHIYRGYSAVATSALAYTIGETDAAPDYREGFVTNRHRIDLSDPYYSTAQGQAIFQPNIYPTDLPEMQEVLERYYDAMTALATDLMRIFAIALGLDEHFFDRFVDKHMTNLNLSNYPDQTTDPVPGQLRAGAHTDYGSLTILRTEDKPGGLEVRTGNGRWVPVPIVPGTFIINIGDLMAQWTNDRWISTMHRVVNPPPERTNGTRRQSVIFFHQPNYDAEIQCLPTCLGDGPRYEPTTSGDHLLMKMRQMTEKPG